MPSIEDQGQTDRVTTSTSAGLAADDVTLYNNFSLNVQCSLKIKVQYYMMLTYVKRKTVRNQQQTDKLR